jgi:putative tryptophan/tyrosine transport system substrate-binding protein
LPRRERNILLSAVGGSLGDTRAPDIDRRLELDRPLYRQNRQASRPCGYCHVGALELMELLKDVVPLTSRIALMLNPATSPDCGAYFLSPVESAAALLKVAIVAAPVHDPAEIEPIMVSLAREPNSGLIVAPDIFILAHREQIIALAAQYRLPAAYAYRLFAASGGLMSYGTDLVDLFRRAAPYVDRILKGEKPADLPVQTPTRYELVINLKTAKAFGLDIPLSVQQRADEVIE